MKTKTKALPKTKTPSTQFVMITQELQENNSLVLKAYTKIVEVAVGLLRNFDLTKYRVYLSMDHQQNPQNQNLINEFVCHFFNITLSNAKDGRSFIFIDCDEDFVEKFGSNLPNRLLREAYKLTQSEDNTKGIEYCLRMNFIPQDVKSYFYKLTFNGEDQVISIITADRAEVA